MERDWEGIARDVLEETGADDGPQDAFVLARLFGVTVRASGGCLGRLDGDDAFISLRPRHERQHGALAHELGHWCLRRAQQENGERGASYLAGALMLPRARFVRDLRATGWDLFELKSLHPNASHEMIARRIAQVRPARIAIIDGRRVRVAGVRHAHGDRREYRIESPGFHRVIVIQAED